MIDGRKVIRLIDKAIAEIHQTRPKHRRGPLKPGSAAMQTSQDRAVREIGLLIAREIVQNAMPRAEQPSDVADDR